MAAAEPQPHHYVPNPYAEKRLIRDNCFTVLLVEDDEADAYLIKSALRRIPKISLVVSARDGVEALRLIDEYETQPDLAVVDLRMPRKDGLTLLSEFFFREHAQFPAIVLTSSTSPFDRAQSWRRGAVEFLTKRDSIEDMTVALEQAIGRLMPDSEPRDAAPVQERRGFLGWLRDRLGNSRLPRGDALSGSPARALGGG